MAGDNGGDGNVMWWWAMGAVLAGGAVVRWVPVSVDGGGDGDGDGEWAGDGRCNAME